MSKKELGTFSMSLLFFLTLATYVGTLLLYGIPTQMR